jgi:intracellular multiplication protein IcmL
MALEHVKQEVLERSNGFYRDHYHRVIIILMIIFICTVGSVGFLLYQFAHRPLPVFEARQQDNQQMLLTPFAKPNLLPDTIIRWASKAATLAYTFDFVNYDGQINAVRPYFTEAGWADYKNSVAGLIKTIVQNQIFVNGIVSGAPVISNQGVLPGKGYVWRVQIPFLVTYQAAETISKKTYYVVISIVEVPTNKNPQGIGIDQFLMV